MINGIPTTTQHNNYHMTERSHVSRHPCCGWWWWRYRYFWYAKYLLTVATYATRNPTRYPDFFPLPYPNPTRSQKALLVSLCLCVPVPLLWATSSTSLPVYLIQSNLGAKGSLVKQVGFVLSLLQAADCNLTSPSCLLEVLCANSRSDNFPRWTWTWWAACTMGSSTTSSNKSSSPSPPTSLLPAGQTLPALELWKINKSAKILFVCTRHLRQWCQRWWSLTPSFLFSQTL